jgi:hypothetical protein
LNANKVEYLIVGGFALAAYGYVRFTGDIDIFYKNTFENAAKILTVLKQFGFGNLGIQLFDLLKKGNIIQLGFSPVRIDLINDIDGIDFETAFNNQLTDKFGTIDTCYISIEDLIKNKTITNRQKDISDIEELQKILKRIND